MSIFLWRNALFKKMRLILLAPLLLLCACAAQGPSTAITVGAIVPLTGDFAVFGQDYLNGARLFIDACNAR